MVNIMPHNFLYSSALSHLSRFLGILNKMLPIYKNIKPAISNLPAFIDKLSHINSQVKDRINNINVNNKQIKNNNNSPTFYK